MAKNDPEKLLSGEDDQFADLDQRAQDLGLETCGSSADSGEASDTSDSTVVDESADE
jgi:hypothetical protein